MGDYEPVDLSGLCNAGLELVSGPQRPVVGKQSFQGLPFQIGSAEGDERSCFLGLGNGLRSEPLVVPIGQSARRVVIAHRLIDSDLDQGGALGKQVAEYVFHLSNGRDVRVPIRERFEISIVPEDIWALAVLPFGAVYDVKQKLYPRYVGPWEEAGRRQEEIVRSAPHSYFVWVWANPEPDQAVESIEIVPAGPRFIVAGITLGQLDEDPDPTRRASGADDRPDQVGGGSETVRPGGGGRPRRRHLPLRAAKRSAKEFLEDDFKGWGEPQNPGSRPAYVEVAATPSATVTVKQQGEVLGEANWGELEKNGTVEANERVRLEVVDRAELGPTRRWWTTRPASRSRAGSTSARRDGIPYAPHGHHAHVNSNIGTWHIDIGGDVRLGQITYAYIDGTLPGLAAARRGDRGRRARLRVRAAADATVTIEPGQRELTLRLQALDAT